MSYDYSITNEILTSKETRAFWTRRKIVYKVTRLKSEYPQYPSGCRFPSFISKVWDPRRPNRFLLNLLFDDM